MITLYDDQYKLTRTSSVLAAAVAVAIWHLKWIDEVLYYANQVQKYITDQKNFVSKVNSLHLQPMDNNQFKPSSIGLVRSGMSDSHSAPGKVHLMPFIGWSDFFMCQKPRELCCHQNRYRSCFAFGITPKYAWDDFIMALSGYPSSMVQWNITRGCRGTCLGGPAMVADQPNEFQVPQIGATRRSNAILAGFVPSSRNTTFLHPRCK